MHYSVKRGIAVACHLSVCLSVTLVDQEHIGWKCRKLMARTVSPTPSFFVAQNPSTYSQEYVDVDVDREILGSLEVGWTKVACWSTKAAISLKRVKIKEKLLWRAYRNSPTLFQTVCFPRFGVRNPHPNLLLLLSQERVKLQT